MLHVQLIQGVATTQGARNATSYKAGLKKPLLREGAVHCVSHVTVGFLESGFHRRCPGIWLPSYFARRDCRSLGCVDTLPALRSSEALTSQSR